MKKIIIAILVLVIVASCSPQKRLTRLINRHPELSRTDTMTLRDTIRTRTIQADTVFLWSQLNRTDTVTLEKDRLKIQLIKKTDSLQIESKCEGDTIFFETKIPVEKVVNVSAKKVKDWIAYFSYGFALGTCVVFFLTIFFSWKFK